MVSQSPTPTDGASAGDTLNMGVRTKDRESIRARFGAVCSLPDTGHASILILLSLSTVRRYRRRSTLNLPVIDANDLAVQYAGAVHFHVGRPSRCCQRHQPDRRQTPASDLPAYLCFAALQSLQLRRTIRCWRDMLDGAEAADEAKRPLRRRCLISAPDMICSCSSKEIERSRGNGPRRRAHLRPCQPANRA
jgi:hypothetical protein